MQIDPKTISDYLNKVLSGKVAVASGDGRTAPLFTVNVTFMVNVGSDNNKLDMEAVGDDKPADKPQEPAP